MNRPRSALLIGVLAAACARPPATPPATPASTTMNDTTSAAPPATPATPAAGSMTSLPGVSERAMRLYRSAIVIDTHNDLPTKILDESYDPDIRNPVSAGQTDLPRLVESGITGQFLSAWVDAPYAQGAPGRSFARAMTYMDTIQAFVRRNPSRLLFATTAADVRRAKAEGKVAILVGVEGGHAIESSLENLRSLYERGARYLTLTWNNGNDWAGASIGVNGTRTGGLTPFGREVVREMNRLGMLVDVSHVSDSTFFDAIAASSAPVIASHSSARAINDHPRNLSDEQLRAIARNGGVVNVNFYSRFLDARFAAAMDSVGSELRTFEDSLRSARGTDTAGVSAEVERKRSTLIAAVPPVPLSVLVDHIERVIRVAGVDHVGLGSDFDGVSGLVPAQMEDVTQLPRIAQALLDRGYSESDVRKILGGNMLRVMTQVLDRQGAPAP